jgi:hypothetical protein
MGLNAFNRARGDNSLRVVGPIDFDETETAAFVLGADGAGWFDDLIQFDGVGTYRTDFDCTGVNVLRARIRLRGPNIALPIGTWVLTVLVNDNPKVSVELPIGRTEDLLDIGVNVSKLTGTQKIEYRLRWV